MVIWGLGTAMEERIHADRGKMTNNTKEAERNYEPGEKTNYNTRSLWLTVIREIQPNVRGTENHNKLRN